MGSGNTPKYNIEYPVSTDATNVPGDFQTAMDEIDNLLSPIYTGTLAARPSAGVAGRFWLVSSSDPTNYGQLFLDTGSAWLAVGVVNASTNAYVGGASLISSANPSNGTASQGSSGLAADAAHQHPMPSWGNNTDPQPPGPAPLAGNSQRFADAQHVHPGGQIGDVTWSFAANPPTGWLLANGQAVSTSDYNSLYAIAVTQNWPQPTAGAGQFNIIDLRDRTPVGAGLTYPLGGATGSANVSISVNNLPSHNHPVTDPGHGHSLYVDPSSGGSTSFQLLYTIPAVGTTLQYSPSGQQGTNFLNFSNNSNASIKKNTTGITTNNTGSGSPVNVVQPVVAMNAFIRAK
jgi:hypothetical protein